MPESLFGDSGSGFFEELPTPRLRQRYGDALRRGVDNSVEPLLNIRKKESHKCLINLRATGKNPVGRGKNPVGRGKKSVAFLPEAAKPIAVTGKNRGAKMDDTGKDVAQLGVVGKSKRGFKRYETNPSVPPAGSLASRTKRVEVPGGKAAVIIDSSSGEIRGIGGMGFWWDEEVDRGQFVKLFLDGIKQAAGLSKAGMKVFEVVYNQVRRNPGKDKIELNYYLARKYGLEMPERTFRHGLRQLLEKEFIYESLVSEVFFVNIRYMFNGDRLAFVRTYHVKRPADQGELPLAESTPALPAPDTADAPASPEVKL
jgi:hypothetical protein